jgi:signal transduction histidine kinase
VNPTLDAESLRLVRSLPPFSGLSDGQLGCLQAGEVIDLPVGTTLAKEGDPPGFFYVTVTGELRLWRSYENQDVLMATNRPGEILGEIAILLGSPWLATARVSQPAKIFRLNEDGFWHMLGTCPSVTRHVLRIVASRFRNIEGFASQREKLISLGTMAAGLAHELNNPASAALRAASYLQEVSDRAQSYMCPLVHGLEEKDWDHLLPLAQSATAKLHAVAPLDSLARSDLEETFGAWLDRHQIPEGWKLAGTFVDSGLDLAWLDNLLQGINPAYHAPVVRWIEARLNLQLLVKQIENSTSRVSELVKAVKSYSHMDSATVQEIDIHEGIESTLTMLGHKLKGVTLRRAFDPSLPRITARAGELNQVWTNLIDNAIDAVKGTGKICVGTFRQDDHIVVEIVDDGPGIPKEVQARMFEPFFTTKEIGSGTGLGLVISNRIVADRHGGEIEFTSVPGETRFTVRLPLRNRVAANAVPSGREAEGKL